MDSLIALTKEQSKLIKLSVINESQLELILELANSYDDKKKVCDVNLLNRIKNIEEISFLYNIIENNINCKPIRSIIRIVRNRFESNIGILENPYLEMEFWDAYSHFHSRNFFSFRKHCWRIHFFRYKTSPLSEDDEKKLLKYLKYGETQESIEEAGYKYIGFITFRPTKSFNLGRSALLFDERKQNEDTTHDTIEWGFCPYCKGKHLEKSHVGLSTLAVNSIPFMQQDRVIGACATTSIWISTRILAKKFGLAKYPYIDISHQASFKSDINNLSPFNSDIGRGLTSSEIVSSLEMTKARVHTYRPLWDKKEVNTAYMKNILYTFVESEIPVIALIKGETNRHTVTIIGHLQSQINKIEQFKNCTISNACASIINKEFNHPHYVSSLCINRFYAHNDTYGPFDSFDFVASESFEKEIPKNILKYKCPIHLSNENFCDLEAIIVPLPPYVKNQPDDILKDAAYRFIKLFTKNLPNANIFWRMLLIYGSDFKNSLINRDYPDILKERYSEIHLPKFIWLCEITIFEEMSKEIIGKVLRGDLDISSNDSGKRPIHGEFIYDTTTPYYSPQILVHRFLNYFVTNYSLPKENELKEFLKKNELDFGKSNTKFEIFCYP